MPRKYLTRSGGDVRHVTLLESDRAGRDRAARSGAACRRAARRRRRRARPRPHRGRGADVSHGLTSDAEPCQSGRAVGRPEVGGVAIDQRPPQRRGQHAAPPRRSGAATDHRDRPDRSAGFDQRVQAVGEPEGHTLEHRLANRRRVAVVRQSEEYAPRLRVVVRGPLAREVGQENLRAIEASAGLDLRQQGGGVRRAGDTNRPVDATRRRQHHRHLVPAVWQGMTEGVYGALWIR